MREYGDLKRVIVGVDNYEKTKLVDKTIKLFFKDNLNDYYLSDYFSKYEVSEKIIEERQLDLNNLAKVLEQNNITVIRPNLCKRMKPVTTPDFKSNMYSNSNVRDLSIVIQDIIICSFSSVRSRFFENQLLYDILIQEIKNGRKVITPPLPTISLSKIDNEDWREFDTFDNKLYDDYEILFDCANCIKVTDNDIIMNVTNKNSYNGYKWLVSVLPTNIKVHPITLCDNHIDGTLLPIREGVFIANTCFLDKDIKHYLPNRFKNWKIINSNDKKYDKNIYDRDVLDIPQLATWEGIDQNVLSISDNTIVCQDTLNYCLDELYDNGFNIIPVKFRHGNIFGGGIHCSTLDLERV